MKSSISWKKYKQHIDELYSTEEYKQKTLEFVKSVFDYIRSYTKDIFTLFEEKVILAQGEIISTNMVTNYLCEQGINAVLLPALEYMRTDKNSEPDLTYIREKLALQLQHLLSVRLSTLLKYRYGQISTVCTTMTHVSLRRLLLYVSYTSKKLQNWLTSAQRFFTLHAYSLQNMQISR